MQFTAGPDSHLIIGYDDVAIVFAETKGRETTSWKVIFDQDQTIRVERQTGHTGRNDIAETQDPRELVAEINGYYGYREQGEDLAPRTRDRLRLFARACEFVSDHLSDLPKGLEIHIPKHH